MMTSSYERTLCVAYADCAAGLRHSQEEGAGGHEARAQHMRIA